MNPVVSILSPCYNGEEYIHTLLNSIVCQTYKNIEFIFINDGSTDSTEHIVEMYKRKFEQAGMVLKYIKQSRTGQALAVNNGLKYVTGSYIGWIDVDDYLEKESIELRVKFLEVHRDYGLVRSFFSIIDFETNKLIARNVGQNVSKEEHIFEMLILMNVSVANLTYLIRYEAFVDTNPSCEIIDGLGQNLQMLLPVTNKYKCGIIKKSLGVVRKNRKSHSYANSYQKSIEYWIKANKSINKIIRHLDISDEYKKRLQDSLCVKLLMLKFRLACIYKKPQDISKYYKEFKLQGYSYTIPWYYSVINKIASNEITFSLLVIVINISKCLKKIYFRI